MFTSEIDPVTIKERVNDYSSLDNMTMFTSEIDPVTIKEQGLGNCSITLLLTVQEIENLFLNMLLQLFKRESLTFVLNTIMQMTT